jgi:tRNA 2-thiouridine synthesizing protein A
MKPPNPRTPASAITVDGTGLRCVTLLLRLRKEIDGAAPGTVVHVIATDPAASLALPAWCHMTGHRYLGPVPDDERPVFALQLASDALPTRADAPWHSASTQGTLAVASQADQPTVRPAAGATSAAWSCARDGQR